MSERWGKVTWTEEAPAALRSARHPATSASRAPLWRIGGEEHPAAGDRREGDSDLDFGIVAPAGALVGVGPGMVEHIFALAVALEIGRRRGDEAARGVFDDDMGGDPAGAPTHRARLLEREKEGVGDERIEPLPVRRLAAEIRRISAGVPRGGGDVGDALDGANSQGLAHDAAHHSAALECAKAQRKARRWYAEGLSYETSVWMGSVN